MSSPAAPLEFIYTNYKGETAVRRVRPGITWWGSTSYHPEPQWLLQAFDVDRKEFRDFAVKDIVPLKEGRVIAAARAWFKSTYGDVDGAGLTELNELYAAVEALRK